MHGKFVLDWRKRELSAHTYAVFPEALFRHYILGLGFLRPLRHLLPGFVGRGLEAMTGTGDLIVRIGGDGDKVIMWPNVLNIDNKLEEITTLIKSRRVVSAVAFACTPEPVLAAVNRFDVGGTNR